MSEPDEDAMIPGDPSTVEPVADPSRYAGEVRLDDGTRLHLRPIQPGDKAALQEGLKRLSRDSVYQRFFSPKRSLSRQDLAYLTELDFRGHVALVATLPDDADVDAVVHEDPIEGGMLVGVGRYIVLDTPDGQPPEAELALTVADPYQGRGIGGALFDRLCAMAGEQGIDTFVGTVLDGNRSIRQLLESHGRIVEEGWDGAGLRVVVRLEACQGTDPST